METANTLEVKIGDVSKNFLDEIKGNHLEIISHFDTDGIASASIMIQTLKKLDQPFSLKIIKSLDKEMINSLDKDKVTLFLDLASSNLKEIEKAQIKKVFIIDHHEIDDVVVPKNIEIVNSELHEKQKISASGLTYLFCKSIDEKNKEFAKLAILGMIGDMLEKEIDKMNNGILEDAQIQIKKGLLMYPSTRPLNRVLEFSSDPYIPGVTGNIKGVLELLRDAGLNPEGGKYKSLIDLSEEEMEKLVTAIILRSPEKKDKELIGNLFLIKISSKLEDAREISAKINACSRDGKPEVAIGLCIENHESKKRATSIHLKYKQQLLAGIKFVQEMDKIIGKKYIIINAKDKIKDTMIGTISSILSNSPLYEKGTIIVAMSYDGKDKIKISSRVVGRKGRNLRELLTNTMNSFEGEVGGHKFAAGCLIKKEDEQRFIEEIKRHLELEI